MNRPDPLEGGMVSRVTIGAGVAFAWSTPQVPVAGHTSVRTPCVVAELHTMALGAQFRCLVKLQLLTVGQVQPRAVLIMTGRTRHAAVVNLQATVKICGSLLIQEPALCLATVTGLARDTDRRARDIPQVRIKHPLRLGEMNFNRVSWGRDRNGRPIGAIRRNSLAAAGQKQQRRCQCILEQTHLTRIVRQDA